MTIKYQLITGLALIGLLTSCVPQRKFEDLQTKKRLCDEDLLTANQKYNTLNAEKQIFENQLAENKKNLALLEQDTARLGVFGRKINTNYDRLNDSYEKLLNNNRELVGRSTSERDRLEGQLDKTKQELSSKETRLDALQKDLDEKRKLLDDKDAKMKQEQAAMEKTQVRIAELEKMLQAKEAAVIALRTKVADALTGLQGNGLNVYQKNGKVYVSLDESLLFAPGKTDVDNKGKDALIKLSKVLERELDINILIEGHTDNVPIKTGCLKDNWDLSVLRATSIVRILLDNSSIAPVRLLPAGRGEFFPIENSDAPEARKKNRRTEIILTPKVDELLKILDNN